MNNTIGITISLCCSAPATTSDGTQRLWGFLGYGHTLLPPPSYLFRFLVLFMLMFIMFLFMPLLMFMVRFLFQFADYRVCFLLFVLKLLGLFVGLFFFCSCFLSCTFHFVLLCLTMSFVWLCLFIILFGWLVGSVQVFSPWLDKGFDVRPTIAVTKAHIDLPEVREAVRIGRLKPDGKVLSKEGQSFITKVNHMSSSSPARSRLRSVFSLSRSP